MLEYTIERKGTSTVCNFKGELTNEYIEELKNIVSKAFVSHEPDFSLELNFHGVTKIDPQCVKVICRAHRISQKLDDSLKVSGLKSDVLGPVVNDMDLKNFTTCNHYGVDNCVWHERCHTGEEGEAAEAAASVETILSHLKDILKTADTTLGTKLTDEQRAYIDSIRKSAGTLQSEVETCYNKLKK